MEGLSKSHHVKTEDQLMGNVRADIDIALYPNMLWK